jgi:hypothetical protein
LISFIPEDKFLNIRVSSGVPYLVSQQNIGDFLLRPCAVFYADDMKLFLSVRGFQDYMKIQSDLNKLSSGAREIRCKTITFSRTRYLVEIGRSGELYKRSGESAWTRR